MTPNTPIQILLSTIAVLMLAWVGRASGEERILGEVRADKALVYMIQPGGLKQQMFAERQWLGVVHEDSYSFVRLDPGEYLIWSGDGAYQLVFVGSGRTYYLRVGVKQISVVPDSEGRSLLDATATYSKTSAEDPDEAREYLVNYSKVRNRALLSGAYKPCRFVDEKIVEYKRKAAAGDADAQFGLGSLYWLNECVERDAEKATQWYRLSAESGDPRAARALGDIYRVGDEVTQDDKEAEKWYRRAAESGDLKAQQRLAEMYHYGMGAEKDMEEAVRWYKRAVEEHEDSWANNRLRKIDNNEPDLKQRRQQRREAQARSVAENKEQARLKRAVAIQERFGKLFVAVSPFEDQAKIELPRRKKLAEKQTGSFAAGNESGIEYMLPPEILLGAIAVAMVYEAIDSSLKKRLTGTEKLEIEYAAGILTRVFQEQALEQGMRRRIVDSGQLTEGLSIYTPVEYKPADLGPGRYRDVVSPGMDLVLEVETTGIGLVLAEKKYRPARFVMANEVRLVRAEDGTVIQKKSMCHASQDSPLFSQWADNRGNLVTTEIESAFIALTEEIQVMLARSEGLPDVNEETACAQLRQTAEVDSVKQDESRTR